MENGLNDTPSNPYCRIKIMILQNFILFAILTLGKSTMTHAQDLEFQIDEGTIDIEFTELPSNQAYVLALQAQGQCKPEISIKEESNVVNVIHVKNCHGNGYREGSLLSLKLPLHTSHRVVLNAGTINVSAAQINQFCEKFSASVTVGDIRNDAKLTNLSVERKLVVGAQTNFSRPAPFNITRTPNDSHIKAIPPLEEQSWTKLQLQVRFGSVRIQ